MKNSIFSWEEWKYLIAIIALKCLILKIFVKLNKNIPNLVWNFNFQLFKSTLPKCHLVNKIEKSSRHNYRTSQQNNAAHSVPFFFRFIDWKQKHNIIRAAISAVEEG